MPGRLRGVRGVSISGSTLAEATYEYEVCFKCHADSANEPQARGTTIPGDPRRAMVEANLRRALDPASAPSFHPVVAPGKNAAVQGLLLGLSVASTIACSDCHASEKSRAGVPRGPHGSSQPHLLEQAYATSDWTIESAAAYALCYKCHDRRVLLGLPDAPVTARSGFGLNGHALHVSGTLDGHGGGAPCSACHDSHGVSSPAGTAANNAHLVNFDVNYVKPNSKGLLQFTATASAGSGNCSLLCHDHDHDRSSYQAGAAIALNRFSRNMVRAPGRPGIPAPTRGAGPKPARVPAPAPVR